MRKILALIGLSASILIVSPVTAESCTCMMSAPPCQAVWGSPVVFAGTVIELDRAPSGPGVRRARFRITEAFRGAQEGEIDIHLRGGGSGSCDPPFQLGQSWLVYADNRWEGGPGWTTSTCSRTRRLHDAAEDLQYLRLPDAQKPASHITGQVQQRLFDISNTDYPSRTQPVAGVPVIITEGKTKVETKTDAQGRYSVPVQPRRSYTVEFGKVEGLTIASYPNQVWVPHHLACGAVDGHARYDGRVAGQVVDNRGRPVPFFPLTLAASPQIPVGGFEKHLLTDATGKFEFAGVDPAAYLVSPSTSLWRKTQALPPLTASPVSVPPAARVETGRLRLPESLKTTLVEIQVVDEDDKPVSGARLTIKQPDSFHFIYPDGTAPTDAQGMFHVSLPAGKRYAVDAWYMRQTPAGAVYETARAVFDATGLKPIRLRLAPAR